MYISCTQPLVRLATDIHAAFAKVRADDPAAPEIVAREPVRDVGSPRGFSLAMECLQDCISNHPTCPKINLDTHLPTRAIDCSDPSHPRLSIGQDVIMPYVALSYVWGGLQPNSTTTKNIEAYTAGIDIELVPKTIQDAIQATNKFGLRYLWVDSFCIIQDSADDKKKELTQMSRIFHDAYFTIIASRAESAFAGFLHNCPLPAKPPPRLPFWSQDGRVGVVSTQPMFTTYNASGEPVTKRAWCLEERLLSARKFVYASDTLHYHCQSAVTSIGDALSGPRNAEKLPDLMFVPDAAVGAHVASWVHGQWRELEFAWGDVIQDYTARAVTKPEDKLTALAGVVEQFDRVWHPNSLNGWDTNGRTEIKRRYLAGLWEHSLMHNLLWARQEGTPSLRPYQYIAPSWSWASIHGEISLYMNSIYLDDPGYLKSCEILACDVTVEDEHLPYGRVQSGVLKICAKMVPTTRAEGSYTSEIALFMEKQDPQGRPLLMVKAGVEGDSSLRCVGDVHVDSIGELEGQVWLVFIVWNISLKDAHAAGLLLTDGGNGKFKRVGFWETPEWLNDTDEEREEMVNWFATCGNDTTHILEII